MHRVLKASLFTLVAMLFLAAASFFGGQLFPVEVGVTPTLETIRGATDLDRWIAESESHSPGVRAGLEKKIEWKKPGQKTPYSIVYLHGWSATRAEMDPVVSQVADRLGANVYYARLTAHGTADGEGFGTLNVQNLVDDARESFEIGRRIGERVIVMGMSTGATLATLLASEDSNRDIAAMILVSPNFYPANKAARYLAGPFGRFWGRVVLGTHRSWEPVNEDHRKYWTSRYRVEGLVALMDLVHYVRDLDYSKIRTPVLTLYTHLDDVVDVEAIKSTHEKFASSRKQIIDLPEATRHEFASQWLGPQAVEPAVRAIVLFVNSKN